MRVFPVAFFYWRPWNTPAPADDIGDIAEAIVGSPIEATDVSGDSDD